MKKRIIVVILVLGIPLFLIYNSGLADKFLTFFGISSVTILLYVLKVIFDDQINTAIKKIFTSFGLREKETYHVDSIITQEAQDVLLHRLKDDVYELCKKNISLIENSEIKFISKLDWKYIDGSNKEHKFTGRLHETIEQTQQFRGKSFAVVGPAGVGKTSAIFDYILHKLSDPENTSIPVYFSLSSWKKEQSIVQWLQQELDKLYRIDKKPAEYFIRAHKMIPFLDGLDQMTQEMRERCILEINDYARKNPVALTSRPKVFNEISEYLLKKDIDILKSFYVYKLQPLSSKQVVEITSKLETKDLFQAIFQKSIKLKSFVRYPMALFLMAVTIRDIDTEEISLLESGSDTDIFNKLWQKYDSYVLDNNEFLNEREIKFDPDKIRNWLQTIAHQKDHSFFIEELQPLVLSTKKMRLYYYLLSRLLIAFFISISIGFFMSGPFDFINAAILSGFVATFVIYLFRRIKRKENQETVTNVYDAINLTTTRNKTVHYLTNIFWYLIPLVFVLWLYFGFSVQRSPDLEQEMVLQGLFSTTEGNVGILAGILMALIFGFRARWQKINIDIKSVEKLSTNLKGFFRYGTVGGVILGLTLMILAFMITHVSGGSGFGLWLEQSLYIKNVYLLSFLVGFLFGFVLFGLMGYLKDSDTLLDKAAKKEHSYKPNYGIRRSIINALRVGAISGTVMVILLGGFVGLMDGEITAIVKASKTGIAFGILGSLWFGGLDVISHYALRFLIWLDNSGPVNYIRFLEEASSLRFIRVVGAGYEFTHPTLKHYFDVGNFTPLKHSKMKNLFIPILSVLLILPVGYSLFQRFNDTSSWHDPHGFEIESYTKFVRKIPNSKNEWYVAGIEDSSEIAINLQASGSVKVGTFTGYIPASGTEASFFGMRISDLYDLKELRSKNHGGVVVQRKKNNKWIAFPEEDIYSLFGDKRNLWIKAKNEEIFKFVVNDSEWQNNKKQFKIVIDTLKTNTKMEVISHRGAGGLLPENTIESVKRAITLDVDKIEIDIHQTKDSVLIVMHDKKVNSSTNGKGKIKDLTYEQIKKLEITHSFENETETFRVPTLEAVLEVIKQSNSSLIIEVKNPQEYPALISTLAETINTHNMKNQVEVFSFDKKFLKELKSTYPEIKTGLFVLGPLSDTDIPGIETVGVYYHSLVWFKSYKTKLQDRGLKVYAWTVNSQKTMQRLIEMKVDGIITDYPDKLQTTLGN